MPASNEVIDPLESTDPRKPQVLLMRHPQTICNLEHRYLGQKDAGLSELGELQRLRAVEGLVSWRPERVVTSPLSRCRGIAEPVGERLHVEVVVDPDVQELCFGRLEGMTRVEAEAAGMPFPWGPSANEWPGPGGEPLGEFYERTARAIDRWSAEPGRTAIVSHGGSIRAMCMHLMNLESTDLWNMSIDNVASAIFRFAGSVAFLQAFGLLPEELAAR